MSTINTIKIMDIDNFEGLFEVVDHCKGQVHLVSNEGDDILLTSRLSRVLLQYMRDVEDDLVNDLEIRCEDPADLIRLINFLAEDAVVNKGED